MVGIPFDILRESERGVEVQRVYLVSMRRGDKGLAMRKAIAEYHRCSMQRTACAANLAKLVNAAKAAADGSDVDVTAIEIVSAQLVKLADDISNYAATVAELALSTNYPNECGWLMDGMTDAELAAIVTTIELGQMPADFSQSLATRRMQSATGPGGSSAEPSSAGQGGADGTGNGAA